MNPLSVLAVIAIVGGIYWAIFFGTKVIDNLSVRNAAEIQIPHGLDFRDDQIVDDVLHLTNDPELGWHREDDEDGNPVEVKGLGLSADNVFIERDEARQFIRIRIVYERDVHLLPTKKWTKMSFEVVKEGSYAPK